MTTESARARGAGVHGIDHFMLEVPDLDEARRFVEAFGLRVEAGDDELRVRASGDHVWCRLRRADRKRLAYVSLGCFASDFAGIRERTLAAKVDLRAAPIAPVPTATPCKSWSRRRSCPMRRRRPDRVTLWPGNAGSWGARRLRA
jgi:catechol 2,3-dioxygenase-like lactoylglutathione lyase family enzyme